MPPSIDPKVVRDAIAVMQDQPTTQHIGTLTEYYSKISYYTAITGTAVDDAEMRRKVAEANAVLSKRNTDPKRSMALLEADAIVATVTEREAENKARMQHRHMTSLLNSIEQTINAVKFLGRNDGVRIG